MTPVEDDRIQSVDSYQYACMGLWSCVSLSVVILLTLICRYSGKELSPLGHS